MTVEKIFVMAEKKGKKIKWAIYQRWCRKKSEWKTHTLTMWTWTNILLVKVPILLRLFRTNDALGWLWCLPWLVVMAANAFVFLAMVTADTDLLVSLCLNYHVVLIDLCYSSPHHTHRSYSILPQQFWIHPVRHQNLTQNADFSSDFLNALQKKRIKTTNKK